MGNELIRGSGSFMSLEICIAMLVFILCMRSFDSKLRSRFIKMSIALILALFAFTVDEYVAIFSNDTTIRYGCKLIKVILEGYIELQTVYVMDSKLNPKKKLLYALPFIITTIGTMVGYVTNLAITLTGKEVLIGPLGYLVYLQAMVYAVVLLRLAHTKGKENNSKSVVIMAVLEVLLFLGALFESMKIFNNSILGTAAICIMIMYMYMYADRYNVDSVTKCYKRRCFYSDGEKNYRHSMAVVSMDLNNLKRINDNYGHKAGDIALQTFANACKEVKTQKFTLYRTGGDEFMMLGVRASMDEAYELIEKVKEKLNTTPYTCSYGVAMYNYGDDFDEIVIKADQAMYVDKKEYKASHTKRSISRNDDFVGDEAEKIK